MTGRRPYRRSQPSGLSLIYMMVVLSVMCAFCSLAVDFGRVQLTKTELRQAADAAARYAVTGLGDGTYIQKAKDAAAQNKADGAAVSLANADIVSGNWTATASPQFSTTRTPVNAVQVTCQRTSAGGNAVKLTFASLLGLSSCDVHASAIATGNQTIGNGFVGLDGISVKNNFRSGGYNSNTNTSPTWSTQSGPGMIASNTSITAGNGEIVGQVVLAPGATQNMTLTQPVTQLSTAIPPPTIDFSGAPSVNPGGIPKNYHVTSSVTLPGGSYYFTQINVDNNADINFSGPATLYIDGSVNFSQDNDLIAYNRVPANLQIYQRGTNTTFGGTNANNLTIVAVIDAPQTVFNVNNNVIIEGRATFKSITVKNNAEFYFDGALNATLPLSGSTRAITLVK